MRQDIISSTSNKQIQRLMRLQKKSRLRREENVFLAEGLRIFREIPKELLREIFVSERFCAEHEDLLEEFAKEQAAGTLRRVTVLREDVFARAADTKTPQGILCIAERPAENPDAAMKPDGIWLVLENLQDPGNIGTIIRTAEGAGAAGIFLTPGCADVYSQKVVRATMGSLFRVPLFTDMPLGDAVDGLKKKGLPVYAAGMEQALSYEEPDYAKGVAFLIGNEGNGLSREALGLADRQISIPMQGQLESLNAAMAAGILMYEADRQRRSRR